MRFKNFVFLLLFLKFLFVLKSFSYCTDFYFSAARHCTWWPPPLLSPFSTHNSRTYISTLVQAIKSTNLRIGEGRLSTPRYTHFHFHPLDNFTSHLNAQTQDQRTDRMNRNTLDLQFRYFSSQRPQSCLGCMENKVIKKSQRTLSTSSICLHQRVQNIIILLVSNLNLFLYIFV